MANDDGYDDELIDEMNADEEFDPYNDTSGDYYGPKKEVRDLTENDAHEKYHERENPRNFANYDKKRRRLLSLEEYFHPSSLRQKRSKQKMTDDLNIIRTLQAKGIPDRKIMYECTELYHVSPRQFYRYLERIRLENYDMLDYRMRTAQLEATLMEGLKENYSSLRTIAFDTKAKAADRVRALIMIAQTLADQSYVMKYGVIGLEKADRINKLRPRELERVQRLISKKGLELDLSMVRPWKPKKEHGS